MKIHCVGIGGIAISGIASIYKQKGHLVQGSDAEASEITAELKKQGIKVFIGQAAKNITKDIELVVYSEAVPADNPELKKAKQLKIKCLSGAAALADLARSYFLIAVSGMHGKSTTASMIAQILIKAGLDPTFIIGTKPGWRLGKSKYLVIEADDYQAKFLHYHPDILVLTNIEEEHMDYFQNFQHIMKVFGQYTRQVKNAVVANKDDKNVLKVLEKFKVPRRRASSLRGRQSSRFKVAYYSLKQEEAKQLKKILRVPGQHNVSNALAALQVVRLLKISDKIALKALAKYRGVWRRLEFLRFKINNKNFDLVSDYAHHPTEIQASLQAISEKFHGRKIWLIFQPHQYQRTFYLFEKFVKTFQKALACIDKLIITDIYTVKGRESENIKKKVNTQKLIKAINRPWAMYLPQNKIINYLKTKLKGGEVVIIMGAGNVYNLVGQLKCFPQVKLTNRRQGSKIK